MNIIVNNKQKEIIDNANIDAIKELTGLFNIDDLVSKLKNYFFTKAIIDATSIVNFPVPEVLEKLATGIGADRLIILLPEKPLPPQDFIERLVNLKIYNFSNNINDVVKFINTPNTYNDIKKFSNNADDFYVDNSIKENDEKNIDVKENISNNPESLYTDDELNIDGDLNDLNTMNNQSNISQPVNNEIVNSERNVVNEVKQDLEVNNNINQNVFLNTNMTSNTNNKITIGIKNITEHAGSTTLTYLLTRIASDVLNKKVLALEVNKNDFGYFQKPNMISVDAGQIDNIINSKDANIVFIDLNNYQNVSICNDVLYLVEPSIIKLNKLMMTNRNIFNELKNKKVVLNKSLLSASDVLTFSKEAGMPMFYNLKPVNDRTNDEEIIKLLNLLGIN